MPATLRRPRRTLAVVRCPDPQEPERLSTSESPPRAAGPIHKRERHAVDTKRHVMHGNARAKTAKGLDQKRSRHGDRVRTGEQLAAFRRNVLVLPSGKQHVALAGNGKEPHRRGDRYRDRGVGVEHATGRHTCGARAFVMNVKPETRRDSGVISSPMQPHNHLRGMGGL